MSAVLQVSATHLNTTATTVSSACNGAMVDGTSDPELKEWNTRQLIISQDVRTSCSAKSSLPYHFVLQDHNYGAPPPSSPPPTSTPSNSSLSSPGSARLNKSFQLSLSAASTHKLNGIITNVKQDLVSFNEAKLNNSGSGDEHGGKEIVVTSVTRCICEFSHDDEYMICCDKCSVWQHVDCMGLDRNNIPETYLCERCEPRKVDKQKAKLLQTKKRGQMNDSSSDESNVEGGRSQRNNHCNSQHNGPVHRRFSRVHGRARRIGRRRKSSSVTNTSTENGVGCGIVTLNSNTSTLSSNTLSKRKSTTKEKLERKRVCERRKRSNSKIGFTPVNEETQDVVLRKWIDQYEEAATNQYSSELLLRLSEMKLNGQCEETTVLLTSLQTVKRCKVEHIDEHTKGLVAIERLKPNQVICEYRGQFYLGSEFHRKNPLHTICPPPFVLWHHLDKNGLDIEKEKIWDCHDSYVCIDARKFGSEARFVRRSCTPNAEVKHLSEKGMPRVYLKARTDIIVNEEITVPFDFDVKSCVGLVKCVCTSENCLVMPLSKRNGLCEPGSEKKRKIRKLTNCSIEGDEIQSNVGCKKLLLCETTTCENISENQISPESAPQVFSDDSQTADTASKDDDGSAGDVRKMTREERKMEAIMKAFERMEKSQQRKQEAQARQQQKKVDQKRKSGEDPVQNHEIDFDGAPDLVSNDTVNLDAIIGPSSKAENNDLTGEEELSSTSNQPNPVPTTSFRYKLKGRRRKTSGAPSRRSSRVNSGGSEICLKDENSQHLPLIPISIGISSCSSTITTSTSSQSQAGSLASPESISTPCPVVVPLPSEPEVVSSPSLLFRPKTKKHLMKEWFNESSEHTRNEGNVEAPYRRCRSPSVVLCSSSTPSISSSHLRKSFSGEICSKPQALNGNMGSAKKRWLRQAMIEDQPEDYTSTGDQVGSPSTTLTSLASVEIVTQRTLATPDLGTPLKKRRLALPDALLPLSPLSIERDDGSGSCDSDKAIPLLCKSHQTKNEELELNVSSQLASANSAQSSVSSVLPSWTAQASEELMPCSSEDQAVSSSCLNNDYDNGEETLAEDLSMPDASRTRNVSPVKQPFVADCSLSTREDAITSSHVASEPLPMEIEPGENNQMRVSEIDAVEKAMDSVQEVAVDLSVGLPSAVSCEVIVKKEIIDDVGESYSNELKDESFCTELKDESYSTELKDESYSTELNDEPYSTELKDEPNPTELNDESYSTKLKEESCFTKLKEESCSTELKDELINIVTGEFSMENRTIISDSTVACYINKENETVTTKCEDLLVSVLTIPPPPAPPLSLCEIIEQSLTPQSFCEDNQINNSIGIDRMVSSPVTSSASSTPLSSPRSTVTSPITASTPLTPVKRKVSLLEYRQRKLENTSSCGSNSSSNSASSSSSSTLGSVIAKGKQLFALSLNDSLIPMPQLNHPMSSFSMEIQTVSDNTTSNRKSSSDGDINWDSTATSVERQRENLTQRLKREFGLMTEEESHQSEICKAVSNDVTLLPNRLPLYNVPMCGPVVGAPIMVIGSNIPTIVGVRNYGSIRAAAPVAAPSTANNSSHPAAVYGTYLMSTVAPPHSLPVVTPPPPPPPPVQPLPLLRTCLVQMGEVPSHAAPLSTGTGGPILPHPFPIRGFPQIQLPPPPPPPPPSSVIMQAAISTVPMSVQQIPLPKPQQGICANSDSHLKDGK